MALVALALLGTPKLFENTRLETIEVDLVPDYEQEPEPEPPKEKEPEKKPLDKTAEWNPFPASAAPAPPEAPDLSPTQTKQKQPQAAQQARALRPPEPQPSAKEPPIQQARPTQTPPTQQALATPTPTPTPPTTPSSPAEPPAQLAQPWIFDPMNIPALMAIPNGGPQSDFDSEATTTANLSTDDRSSLKQHLKKCWKLPDGMSTEQSTRVTLRIFLKRDGGLASEPILIEASASRDGPRLMQAAIRSVKECQPYAFLPADRYREWKALDVTFSPKEMAGG
jgi:hypothetical protein